MAIEKITMPQLGESVTEGTVNAWLVSVGDKVKKYDPIAEVLTDKVNAEVPSSYTGIIKEITTEIGDTIAVGELMCYIETSEDEQSESHAPEPVKSNETGTSVSESESMKKRYSPAVLRLAQENNIDLSKVSGTGRSGRITRKDMEKVIQNNKHSELQANTPEPPINQRDDGSVKPSRELTQSQEGDLEIPVTGMRKTIASNMVKSKHEIPHAWMQVEVDVTDLVAYRNEIKDAFKQKEGFNITYFPFFIKAVARALKEFPQLNSTWADDKIIQRKNIHVSIAVANENELLVPVIKNADEKSIKGIAKDIDELAKKARSGNLSFKDMQDGTFTVNNTGTFGSIHSMGIINYPQAALLQVETIVKRPVIIDNMFAARDMVNLSLSLDHRILDGLICGKFLASVKENLENMNSKTLEIY